MEKVLSAKDIVMETKRGSSMKLTLANSKFWKRIAEELSQLGKDDKLILDFRGVEIEPVYENPEFKSVFSDERLNLIIYNNESFYDSLDFLNRISGLNVDRIKHEVIEDEVKQEKKKGKVGAKAIKEYDNPYDDARVQMLISNLESCVIDNSDGTYTIQVHKAVDQISYKTVYWAVKHYTDQRKDKKGKINLGNIAIGTRALAEDFLSLENCEIVSSNRATVEQLKLYKGAVDIPDNEKARIFREECGNGMVGTLYRYKETTGRDEFNRMGNGVPLFNAPAILRQISPTNNGGVMLTFEVYDYNTFETNDNRIARGEDPVDSLNPEILELSISEVGFDYRFTGSLYNFNTPIHDPADELEKTFIYVGSEAEKYRLVEMTQPAYIGTVLDSFGIKYNVMKLQEAMGKSNKALREAGKIGKKVGL